ncbi:MFS transporter, partial [Acinetobacter baumannii]
MLFTGWLSDRSGERVRFLFVSTLLVTLAYALFAAELGPVPALIGYLLYVSAWGSVTLSVWMVCTDMVAARHMAVGTAAINTLSQIGAFLCP